MEIRYHPLWKSLSPLQKPTLLVRIVLGRKIASLYHRSTYVGIAGSVGKTAAALFAQAVLSKKFQTISSSSELPPSFAIPKLLLGLKPKIKKVILEMGIEIPGEIDFFLSLVKPATAIITRIGYSNSLNLGNIDQISAEMAKLLRQLPTDGFAIINYDDIQSRKLAELTEAKVIFYGGDAEKCLVWASKIRIENYQTAFELNHGVERVSVSLKMLGSHWVSAALAAATLGIINNISLTAIKKGLESIETLVHRLQLYEGLGPWMVLDDTYSSCPVALEEALNVVNILPARRRIIVLGEMKDLGKYSETLHRQIAQRIYKDKMDLVLLGGGDAAVIGDELYKLGFSPDRMEINLSNSQMVNNILRIAGKGDLILVKGSFSVRLDEVVKRITRQT